MVGITHLGPVSTAPRATRPMVLARLAQGPSGLSIEALQAVLKAIGDREETTGCDLERVWLRHGRHRLEAELAALLLERAQREREASA